MCIDRRKFIKFGALSTAMVTLGAQDWAAAAIREAVSEPAPVPPDAAARAADDDNPNAAQARPIASDEYMARQEQARRYMRDEGIDAIFFTGGSSLHYFTGIDWGLSERLFAMVLPAKGEPGYVTPAFEKTRALEQIKSGADVRAWQEDENPYQLVAGILKDRGISSGRLGVEETVKFAFSDGVSKAAPAVKLSSADPVTARCRRIKSAHEIELMRLANRITLKSFENALKGLREGMTDTNWAYQSLPSTARWAPRAAPWCFLEPILLPHMAPSLPSAYVKAISSWWMGVAVSRVTNPTLREPRSSASRVPSI